MIVTLKQKGIYGILCLSLIFSLNTNIIMSNQTYGNGAYKLSSTNEFMNLEENLEIHFIDVGDAESILIQQGKNTMLIDAGNNKDKEKVIDYLNKKGIKKIDILIGTHPHEDHIGSLDTVINTFDIGKVYLPECDYTNRYLEDIKTALTKKGLKEVNPYSGDIFVFGDAKCTILAPVNKGYDSLNNYSIVMRVQYGQTSILFTGDAEKKSENEMLRRGYNLSSDVLKLGHHGSISSTSEEFLERVNPKMVVLVTDSTNKFKHPHRSIMKRLKAKGIKVYRTDESGTIIMISNGKDIKFNVKPGSFKGALKVNDSYRKSI